MGMFDYIRCAAPLPLPQYSEDEFQTKDTEGQFLDEYEIRADGTLWVQEYDVEDRSDPDAEGLERIVGMMTRVNEHWKHLSDYTGTIFFYTGLGNHHTGWVEFKAVFVDGKLHKPIELIEHRPPDPAREAEREQELKEFYRSIAQRNQDTTEDTK